MELKDIVEVKLYPENPQKDLGVVRIEQVSCVNADGDEEDMPELGFGYQYSEESQESYMSMVSEIAQKLGVSKDIINVEYGEDL